jgi:hypothetical protein
LKKKFFIFSKFLKSRCITRNKLEKFRKMIFLKKFENLENRFPKTFCNHLCKISDFLLKKSTKNPLQILGTYLYTKIFTQIIEVCQIFFVAFGSPIFVGTFSSFFQQLFVNFYTDDCKAVLYTTF